MNNFWLNRNKDRLRYRGGWEIKDNHGPISLIWHCLYEEEMPLLHEDYVEKDAAFNIYRTEIELKG